MINFKQEKSRVRTKNSRLILIFSINKTQKALKILLLYIFIPLVLQLIKLKELKNVSLLAQCQ